MEDANTSARTIRKPPNFNTMTEEEIVAKVQKSLDSAAAGKTRPAKEFWDEMERWTADETI
ncbi:MAG: hypothetical protein LBU77_01145 [Clostridiales bacterium]|jgi:hypothetical protein|nr:hypothetical protein [Clostridiales bacterium]